MNQEVNKALSILKKGGTLLYPTDTVWGIGCDACNFDAISKIYALKQRQESKAMICLVSDFKMLENYIEEVPEVAYDLLKLATKPTTIVYEKPIRVATNLIAEDNTLGLRVIKDGFAHKLIKKLERPLVSTSANISGHPTPKAFKEISQDILKGVDYVVNLPNLKSANKPSSVIKINNNGTFKILRS